MALGPGKYDAICTKAREEAQAETCVLIITNGRMGHGFSVQSANLLHLATLPRTLREIADSIERDWGKS